MCACRNLRRLFLDAATSVGVPDAVDWAQRAFNSWMKYETRLGLFYQLISLMYSPQKGKQHLSVHVIIYLHSAFS